MRSRRSKTNVTVQENPAYYVADQIQDYLEEQNWSEEIMLDDNNEPRCGIWLACCCCCLPVCLILVMKNSFCPLRSKNEEETLLTLIKSLDIIAQTTNPASTAGMFAQGTDPKALRVIDAINNALLNGSIVTFKSRLENLKMLLANINGAVLPKEQKIMSEKRPLIEPRPVR